MATYLLLRNNKESGPFSRDQLLELGLKAYDLVWVEGKSAAWRYPSEVTELKDFAPVVEEQPYDRFFKKKKAEGEEVEKEYVTVEKRYAPVEVKFPIREKEYSPKEKEHSEPEKVYSSFSTNASEYSSKEKEYSDQEKVYSSKKEEELSPAKEYPSLNEEQPAQDSSQENEYTYFKKFQPQQKETRSGAVSVIMPQQPAAKKPDPVYAYVPAEKPVASTPKANNLDLETNYSVPLDEIKEKYVRQLQERKQRTAQKKFLVQTLKRAAIFLLVIGSGVLIGFAIKPKRSSKDTISNSLNAITPATMEAAAKKGEQMTDSLSINPAATNSVKDEAVNNTTPATKDDYRLPVENKKAEVTATLPVNPEEKQPATTNQGERNKSARKEDVAEPVERKNESIGDLSSQVMVKANDYRLRDFGGFRNLELTVTNDSKAPLDNVLVELQYLKINDEPIKVEHIPFRSISPGGSLTIRIPDNNRGAKLTYKIIKIDPKN